VFSMTAIVSKKKSLPMSSEQTLAPCAPMNTTLGPGGFENWRGERIHPTGLDMRSLPKSRFGCERHHVLALQTYRLLLLAMSISQASTFILAAPQNAKMHRLQAVCVSRTVAGGTHQYQALTPKEKIS
jgi:hypothetical protein